MEELNYIAENLARVIKRNILTNSMSYRYYFINVHGILKYVTKITFVPTYFGSCSNWNLLKQQKKWD